MCINVIHISIAGESDTMTFCFFGTPYSPLSQSGGGGGRGEGRGVADRQTSTTQGLNQPRGRMIKKFK